MRDAPVILLDVNVWLSLLWRQHVHHQPAKAWFDGQEDELGFCRVSHMGVLRLLTNPSVMGTSVLKRDRAWQVLDELFLDSRVVLVGEPLNIEPFWRVVSSAPDHSHKLWTDDYLAAFAMATETLLVTFDRAFETRYPSVRVESLV